MEPHVQNNKYVEHQEVKIYCATNQFTELQFIGPHNKPYGVRRLCKNYHMHFDPKLGHVKCTICGIPCDCTLCTSIMDQPWVPGFP